MSSPDCLNMNGCGSVIAPSPPSITPDNGGATLVECEPLAVPDHGTLNVDERVATYGCNEGFALSGDQSRTCQSDGTWTGEAPTCIPSCKSE